MNSVLNANLQIIYLIDKAISAMLLLQNDKKQK